MKEELIELLYKPKRMNKAQSYRHTLSVLPKVARSPHTKGSGTHKSMTMEQVFKELKFHKRVFIQHLGRKRKMEVRRILEECESALFNVGIDHRGSKPQEFHASFNVGIDHRGLHIEATHEIIAIALRS